MGKPLLLDLAAGAAAVLPRLAARPPVAAVALLNRQVSAADPRSRVDSSDWLRLAMGAGHTSASCRE
jgi:hypothetical protein